MRRAKLQAILAVLVALGAYLHFDPASPWDPFFRPDPKPFETPERRAAALQEYRYMLEDPWVTTNPPTREGVLRQWAKAHEKWPDEFPEVPSP